MCGSVDEFVMKAGIRVHISFKGPPYILGNTCYFFCYHFLPGSLLSCWEHIHQSSYIKIYHSELAFEQLKSSLPNLCSLAEI